MQKRQRFSCQRNVWIHTPQGGGEGYSVESLVGVWLQLVSDQKMSFFHNRFLTQHLKSIPVFRPGHLELMSSLLRLEHQQRDFLKSILNLHHLLLPFVSYLFGVQVRNTFIHSQSSLINHTRFQTKRAKSIPVFRPKQCKNDILHFGAAHTYMASILSDTLKIVY